MESDEVKIVKSGVKAVLDMIQRLYPSMNPAELDAAAEYARMAAELISKVAGADLRAKLEKALGAPLEMYVEQCKEKRKSAHGIGAAEEVECHLKMLFAVLLIPTEEETKRGVEKHEPKRERSA